ncbi:phospholipase A and acyltransferase 1-like [Scomber scombrus]|uniref:Phospholipase A and acyltransferase 1-like n=1 Tax=Scomber scombrus TaxID=13677 RepID=A0AAV1P7K6_SCOSC
MRSLILVAVILQLTVIIIECHNYKFGDMIAFPRRCGCIKKPVYKHFAIYVGDKPFPGKQPGQDIFHHTLISLTHFKTGCVFGVLGEKVKHELDNSLDNETLGTHTYIRSTDEVITERINNVTRDGCGGYNPLTNNCEHLATYVRYGHKISRQEDTWIARICRFTHIPIRLCIKYEEALERIEKNALQEAECWENPSCAHLAG